MTKEMTMNMKTIIEAAVAFCILLGITLGAMAYFAKAKDLELVDMRLNQKIVNDNLQFTRQQMYHIENRQGNSDCNSWTDKRDRDDYRKLKEDLEKLQKKRDVMLQRSGGKG